MNQSEKNGRKIKLSKEGKVVFRGVKTYVNGDKYEGEFVDHLRHGQGRMWFVNGDIYDGEFDRNYFHGYGTYIWSTFLDNNNHLVSGKKYVGDWFDGKKQGKGVFTLGTGDIYSGMFLNDLYDGEGRLKKSNGDILEGEWSRGRPYGNMKIQFNNGDQYEGIMIGGHYEGQGKLTYANEMGFYEGQWHNGKYHGKGVRLYSNGGKYVGDFFEGEIAGEGMMFFSNGDQYLGSWKNGIFEGKGVYRYANGESYEGGFMRGARHGEGKYRYSDGSYYHGEYRNVQSIGFAHSSQLPLCDGKRHGTGIRVWSTGARYEGQWANDKMNGSGLLNTADGGKYEGGFVNGLRSGKGVEHFGNMVGLTFFCPLGCKHAGVGFCVYTGEYKQGLFHGFGEMRCMNGQFYKGMWCRGKKHGEGEFFFLRDGEIGDAKRLFIGGVDSLYRYKSYKGQYVNDERQGNGVAIYTNGDTLEGHFEKGQPHGTIVCTFYPSNRVRLAKYNRGQRVEWIELHTSHIKSKTRRSVSIAVKSEEEKAQSAVEQIK